MSSSVGEYYEVEKCIEIPPNINSMGLKNHIGYSVLQYSLTRLELQIALIFCISQSCHHFLLKHLGQQTFISQIIAGLIIGMTLKGTKLFEETEENTQVLGSLAGLGFAFVVFLSAVKTDMSMIWRSGQKPLCIGGLTVLVPLLYNFLVIAMINTKARSEEFERGTFILASKYAVTPLPGIALLLNHLKILNTELGRLGLSSALVADFLSLLVGPIGGQLRLIAIDKYLGLRDLGIMSAFLFLVIFVLRPVLSSVAKDTPEGKPVKRRYIYAIFLLFLTTLSIAKSNAIFFLSSPVLLGLAVPVGPPLGSAIVDTFDGMASGLLLPLFVCTCALRMNFSSIKFNNEFMNIHALFSITATIAKFFGALAVPLYCKMPTKDALALALIMSSKSIVDLGIITLLNENQFIPDDVTNMLLIGIIFSMVVVPILVKRLHDPLRKYSNYQKRNLADSNPTDELKIVACIHVPADVVPVINLLDCCCPSTDRPIVVNVLQLIKLVGRATPLFISHQKQPENSSKALYEISYCESIICLFNQFELDNWKAVVANTFTAVSLPSFMNEDIRNLALDQQASLILLPFHRRWYTGGTMESEDSYIRAINCKILERAPCSVGILLERGPLRQFNNNNNYNNNNNDDGDDNNNNNFEGTFRSDPLFKVAMIFMGGADDREALTLTLRMAQNSRISTKVFQVVVPRQISLGLTEWDIMLDSLVLRDAKNIKSVNFEEIEVNGGYDTATIVRSMANRHDLFVVGRGSNLERPQTSGLQEWSEFSELGPIGDLLASEDLNGSSSVLVVQQQRVSSSSASKT